MKKSTLTISIVVVIALAILIFNPFGNEINGNVVSAGEITMYKSPTCGCCVGNSQVLKADGFDVNIVPTSDMSSIKAKYNIPRDMESCHTSIIGDYFVEGHIPTEIINKLLEEQPDIDGIALPNMPAGSPGMPGVKSYEWIIYALKDGKSTEYMRY